MKRSMLAIALIAAMLPCAAYADEQECESWDETEASCDPIYTADWFMFNGVASYGGYEWTWYSEKVLPGEGLTELNANGRTVNESGYVVDGDGFIAVASPHGVDEIGTVIESPFGLCKVYDTCESGNYDVYTSW